jgi:hypothetical protein
LTGVLIFLIFILWRCNFCFKFRKLCNFILNRIPLFIVMKITIWNKSVLVGIFCLVLSTCLFATTRQEIESALEEARRELRISIAMEKRITSELAGLKKSGDASPDIIEDYELYLNRVKAMVSENRKVVEEMEALNTIYENQNKPGRSSYSDNAESKVDPAIPEEQVVDEVTVLDRQLDASLAKFDDMLLRELDLILAKSSERMRDLAAEAEAAAQRLRDQGIEIDADSAEESDEARAESGQDSAEEPKKTGTEDGVPESVEEGKPGEGRDDSELSSRGKSRQGVEGSKSHPGNRYDPKDDDIVARQLREAAEEETDPELREKLWNEYEQYKKNSGR